MRIVRYFFVGAVAAAVDIGLFTVFARLLGYNYLVVAACTFVLATLVNYVLSVRHVFKSGTRFGRAWEVALVFGVSAIGLAINQGVLFVAVDKLRWDLVLSKILATGVVFLWNYQLRANLVFKARSPPPTPRHAPR
jgi:putative flippase GtrA